MDFTFSPLLGILGAAILGGAIGLQRQAAHKAAGFRTHLIVAAAAASFTAMGAHLHDTRIPSYVVVGIGFLGAGAIIRQGATAHGLTTAATIWMASAVGLLLGYANAFGLWTGLFATAITLVALTASDSKIMRIFGISRRLDVKVKGTPGILQREAIENIFRRMTFRFEDDALQAFDAEPDRESFELRYNVNLPRSYDIAAAVRQLRELPGVERVSASEPLIKA